MVIVKLIQNPDVRVLKPFEFLLRRAAFFCSSDVRATAPMSASLVPMNALYIFLEMLYHAVSFYDILIVSYCNAISISYTI